MKRLHIKSAYPMPRQLQAAAERKKIMQQQTPSPNMQPFNAMPSPNTNLNIVKEEAPSNNSVVMVEEMTSIPNLNLNISIP
jgi:hypothetical protein